MNRFLIGALLLLGCDHPCRPGTLFVTLELDTAAQASDRLQITTAIDGGDWSQVERQRPRREAPSDTVEIGLAPYPAGKMADLRIVALHGADPVAFGERSLSLPEGCATLSVPVAAQPLDGGADDGQTVDLAMGDSSAADLLGVDLLGTSPPSCTNLAPSCGATGNDDCCATAQPIPGGSFYRSYDGVTSLYDAMLPGNLAMVSDFKLDKYEVTVGRFRKWVDAGFPRPAQGAGARTLNGMANQGGWEAAWDAFVASSTSDLKCQTTYSTWTDLAGLNEDKAMTCLNWYDAFAFCVWDGGHLPTEAELNYAAAGGGEQRVYPWSVPAMSTTIDFAYAVFDPGSILVARVGSKSPLGDGRWGHADLAGNVDEWALDLMDGSSNTYPATPGCNDCADLVSTSSARVTRGGGVWDDFWGLRSCMRDSRDSTSRHFTTGARCARE